MSVARFARTGPALSTTLVAAAAAVMSLAPPAATPAQAQSEPDAIASETTSSHGISAFGELKYAADFPHFDYVAPDAPKGGSLSTRPSIATRTFDSFNPYILKGDAADGTQLLFDTLMARAADEPDAVYGLLAESVEMPADRSFAIFSLRPEARFADGSPVTAEDVAWSVTALKEMGRPVVRLSLRDVERVAALDERRVRFDFAEAAPKRDLPARVALQPIFSKAWFAERPFDEASLEPPLASGPYRVGDFAQGRKVTYVRRDDYWAADLPVRRGQFNFDEISFEYFLDHDVALEAFKSGAFDVIENFISKNWATKYDFPGVRNGWVIKAELPDGRPSGTQGFWLNSRRAVFADPRVRAALDLAFDYEWTNQKLFFGLYARTNSFFENSDLQAEGPPDAAERALLEAVLDEGAPDAERVALLSGDAYEPPVTDGSGRNRRNLRAAGKLLEAAGWTVQDGVRKNADGATLTIEFLDRVGSSMDRIVEPFIANLERLGIQATMRQVDAAQYELRQKAYDYDIVSGRFPLQTTPGPELRGYLSSDSAAAEGSFNLAGVSDPVIDALLERMSSATSREELRVAAKALDRVFRAGHYWIPHWYLPSYRMAWWDRFGRPADRGIAQPPYDRAILSTWWFDLEKDAALEAARGG